MVTTKLDQSVSLRLAKPARVSEAFKVPVSVDV